MSTDTVRPNARVKIVRLHPRYQEMTVRPVNHDGTCNGPEKMMGCNIPISVYRIFKENQVVDLWTSDGLPLDRRVIGRTQGAIHALSYPEIKVGRAAAIAIAANSQKIDDAIAMSDAELFQRAERFMRSRVGEVSVADNGEYVFNGQINMSMNTRGLLYDIRTLDAGKITIALGSDGSLNTMFFTEKDHLKINWRSGQLEIHGLELPDSAAEGMVGRPVGDIVENPLLAGTIESVETFKQTNGGKSVVRLGIALDPVGTFVPGSQWIKE